MEKNHRVKSYLLNTKEPYILEIDNVKVEITYSKANKSLKDCMVNVLKQKMRK